MQSKDYKKCKIQVFKNEQKNIVHCLNRTKTQRVSVKLLTFRKVFNVQLVIACQKCISCNIIKLIISFKEIEMHKKVIDKF